MMAGVTTVAELTCCVYPKLVHKANNVQNNFNVIPPFVSIQTRPGHFKFVDQSLKISHLKISPTSSSTIVPILQS